MNDRSLLIAAMTAAVLAAAVAGGGAAVAQAANGETARPLSAFFGLDNRLPAGVNLLCQGAAGKDGMPVVLSHTVDAETLQPEDFRIVTESGSERTPLCTTLRPAGDPGELRTVLLIGEFGNADDDPPVKALVVGDLLSDGVSGEPVNFRGTETSVTPLDAGPSLVLAEVVPEDRRSTESRGTACPEGTRQVVRATWAGGVRLPNGDELGDAERALYRVTVERPAVRATRSLRRRSRIWGTGTTTTFCASIRRLRQSRSAFLPAIWSTPIRT